MNKDKYIYILAGYLGQTKAPLRKLKIKELKKQFKFLIQHEGTNVLEWYRLNGMEI